MQKTKDELVEQIKSGKWNQLLRRVNIKPGDFFFVPSGTIHALCEGTIVLETQQSSDTTYRVYDYDRKDTNGNLRELHLEKAIEVITVPHQDIQSDKVINTIDNLTITNFVDSDFFTVRKWDVKDVATFSFPNQYLLLSVIKGNGILGHNGERYLLNKGKHLIIPVGFGEFEIKGECEIMVSYSK